MGAVSLMVRFQVGNSVALAETGMLCKFESFHGVDQYQISYKSESNPMVPLSFNLRQGSANED